MPSQPEYIGKAHEKLTRDILNGVDPQPDTIEQLRQLDDPHPARVKIGAKKAAEFISNNTSFDIIQAIEVGDERKGASDDDTDMLVRSEEGDEKPYSLKLLTDNYINIRNPTLRSLSRNIFGEEPSELLTEKEYEAYQHRARQFSNDDIASAELAGPLIRMLESKFKEFQDRNEGALREALLGEIRLSSNTVACKVTLKGEFDGFASLDREPLRKLREGVGNLDIYTRESNATSLFFAVDKEPAFRIDFYGQSQGSTRKPNARAAIRVLFGPARADGESTKQTGLDTW